MKITAKTDEDKLVLDKEIPNTLFVKVGVGMFGISETVNGEILITFMSSNERKITAEMTDRGLEVGGK